MARFGLNLEDDSDSEEDQEEQGEEEEVLEEDAMDAHEGAGGQPPAAAPALVAHSSRAMPDFAAPAAEVLFTNVNGGNAGAEDLDGVSDGPKAAASGAFPAYFSSPFSGGQQGGLGLRTPPGAAREGVRAAAREPASLTPRKRPEPPMQIAYTVAASIVNSSRW